MNPIDHSKSHLGAPKSFVRRASNRSLPFSEFDWATPSPKTRQVVTRKPHRKVGRCPAPWIQDHALCWESGLERNFSRQASFCPGVIGIRHQPVTLNIHYRELVVLRKQYTPDFLITFDDGSQIIVEIRHQDNLLKDLEFFNTVAKYFNASGYSFGVFTAELIYATPFRTMNTGELFHDARASVFIGQDVSLIDGFVGSFSQLRGLLGLTRQQTFGLIGQQNFDFSLNKDLESEAILTFLGEEAGSEYFYSSNWFGV